MRYPCIGFPSCLKTFENGYVLRGHQLSCEHAQKEINSKNIVQEHAREVQYHYNINGIKCNKTYPKFTGLDDTQRLNFRDRFHFGGVKAKPYRPLNKPVDSSIVTPQTKSIAMDLSGYYT
ncbi:unnamed protein product [Rotaria magnacalcarata]|uniref:Uncharacterized protein n=2 Tax=Rotaria magnacalcarata TaxID=392030 RepID=A0A814JMU1_9BILA|nr:unnamed protein product [Rotaria magnacalcarata]CAF4307971.1 unnamed protein product [Rotaria magnacalcarata]